VRAIVPALKLSSPLSERTSCARLGSNPLQGPTLEDLIELGVITPATRKYDPTIDKPQPNPGNIDLVAALLADRAAARY